MDDNEKNKVLENPYGFLDGEDVFSHIPEEDPFLLEVDHEDVRHRSKYLRFPVRIISCGVVDSVEVLREQKTTFSAMASPKHYKYPNIRIKKIPGLPVLIISAAFRYKMWEYQIVWMW